MEKDPELERVMCAIVNKTVRSIFIDKGIDKLSKINFNDRDQADCYSLMMTELGNPLALYKLEWLDSSFRMRIDKRSCNHPDAKIIWLKDETNGNDLERHIDNNANDDDMEL